MLSLCVLAVLACPQDPFDLNAPVQGTVRDESGQPIARARVQIIAEKNARGYTIALSSALWSQPLQPSFSGRDGTWVMPLTDLHRSLYGGGPGSFSLRVTAPGYQAWHERLVAGLGGFLGSDIVLHKPTAAEIYSLDAGTDRAGGLILITRKIGGGPAEFSTVPIGEDGKAIVTAPRFPTPLILSATRGMQALEHTAQALKPGYSTHPVMLLPRTAGKIFDTSTSKSANRRVSVRMPEGVAAEGLRGLYSCPDGEMRWFDSDGPELLSDHALKLRFVTADGMIACDASEGNEVQLVHQQEITRDQVLHIVDPDGNPIRDVSGYLWPITAIDGLSKRPRRVYARRPLSRITAADGKLTLSLRHLAKPTILEVRAAGWHTELILEPRGQTVAIVLQPEVTGSLELTVTDKQGTPIDDVLVFLDDYSLGAQPRPKRVMRTSDGGLLVIPNLEIGRHDLRLTRKGFASTVEKYHIEETTVTRLSTSIERIIPIRVLTEDDDGKAIPFVSLKLRSRTAVRAERSELWSDSRGRLTLADTSVESAKISQRHIAGSSTQHELDSSEPVKLTTDTSDRVFVRTPASLQALRYVIKHGGGGSTSSSKPDSKRPILGYFLSWTQAKQLEVRIGLGSGPPIRIREESLKEARRVGLRLVVVDQSKIVRRQRILLEGPSPESLKHLRIEPRSPHHGGAMISTKIGSLAMIDASNQAFFVARDRFAWNCRIMHPEFRVLDLAIDAAQKDGEPIRVKLEKATPLSFKIRLTQATAKGFDYNLTIRHKKKGGFVVYAQDQFTMQGKAGDIITLRCPVGLQPGPYTYGLKIVGGTSSDDSVTLDVDTPLIIDLTKEGK